MHIKTKSERSKLWSKFLMSVTHAAAGDVSSNLFNLSSSLETDAHI